MTTAELLADLGPETDLALLVRRVCRDQLPWVVVSSAALTGWMRRDPAGWDKVSTWLDAQGVTIVRI